MPFDVKICVTILLMESDGNEIYFAQGIWSEQEFV